VTSEGLGKGSCFSVEIPLKETQPISAMEETEEDILMENNASYDPKVSHSSARELPFSSMYECEIDLLSYLILCNRQ